MSAFIPKRRSRGEWIAQQLASQADIRTPADLFCFIACALLTAALGWMVFHPVEFFNLVMGVFR